MLLFGVAVEDGPEGLGHPLPAVAAGPQHVDFLWELGVVTP